jgi:hypothetical protein
LQDPLQCVAARSPGAPGFLGASQAPSQTTAASIRSAGYLHEHMFPSRSHRALQALLEVADAMLAPTPSSGAGTVASRTSAEPVAADAPAERRPPAERRTGHPAAAHPHPHRRPLHSRRSRRPAPPAARQPCLSPVALPGDRAATRAAGAAAGGTDGASAAR